MKPESKLEIARRRLSEAEGMVERQVQHIAELGKAGRSTQHAISLLALLHGSLQAYRDALDIMEAETR